MKHCTCLSISMLFAILAWGVVSQTAMAQDVVQVAPQQYKVLLDNERVRVIEYQSKPGEKAGMYAHPASVAYFLSPAKLKFTSPDGKTAEVEVKAGQSTPCLQSCARKRPSTGAGVSGKAWRQNGAALASRFGWYRHNGWQIQVHFA